MFYHRMKIYDRENTLWSDFNKSFRTQFNILTVVFHCALFKRDTINLILENKKQDF